MPSLHEDPLRREQKQLKENSRLFEYNEFILKNHDFPDV